MKYSNSNETTKDIYSLDSLKEAYSEGRRFNFVIFNDFTKKDIQLNPVTVGCFSPFFPIEFVDSNKTHYSSVIQYIYAQKANLFKDQISYNKIISSKSAKEAEDLGGRITNFHKKTWFKKNEEFFYQGNLLKFTQNEKLRKFILSFPQNTIFVNANPDDKFWGVQNIKDRKTFNPFKWRGSNASGFQLTKVRDTLLVSEENTDCPIFQSYKLSEIPGIYGGEYPGDIDKQTAIKKINQMIQFGIRHFIDLTEKRELIPYRKLLPPNVTYFRFPIQHRGVPDSIDHVTDLIDQIVKLKQKGGFVYIHCWSGNARTSLIMACLIGKVLKITDYDEVFNILKENCSKIPKLAAKKSKILNKKRQVLFVNEFLRQNKSLNNQQRQQEEQDDDDEIEIEEEEEEGEEEEGEANIEKIVEDDDYDDENEEENNENIDDNDNDDKNENEKESNENIDDNDNDDKNENEKEKENNENIDDNDNNDKNENEKEKENNENIDDKVAKEIQTTRDVPVYFLTDIHLNPEPLNGIVNLDDGFVAVNGDIVTGVVFLHDKKKLGCSKSRSLRWPKKGTWTDPLSAINILKRRNSKYPLIASFGNHELNLRAFRGSSIPSLEDWINSIKQINGIPLCTFPNYSGIGVEQFYQYKNTYFFSYVTSKMFNFLDDFDDDSEYENAGISEISNLIKKVCDSETTEIILLCHTGFNEGSCFVEKIINKLAKIQSKKKLEFDLLLVNFVVCFGHSHGSSIKRRFRVNDNYWEGIIALNVLDYVKNIYCIFPRCADDCVEIEPSMQKCVKEKFITKKNH